MKRIILTALAALTIGASDARVEHVTSAISKLPTPKMAGPYAETPEQLALRLRTIARANLDAVPGAPGPIPPKMLLAMNIATQWHETKFAHDVHAGELGKWGSDDGRARCLGQLHVTDALPREVWERTAGTDLESTLLCSVEGMRVLQRYGRMCRWDGSDNAIRRTLWGYASGKGCDFSQAPAKINLERRVLTIRGLARVL